jgi:hypothetical protein
MADVLAIPRLLDELEKRLRANKCSGTALSVLRKVAVRTESVKDALTENIKGSLPVYAHTSIETHVYNVSC